jgi:hypothetical protein
VTFGQAAYARQVLRAMAGEKTAGVLNVAGDALGTAGRAIGKGANWAWRKSMQHNGPVMGTLGLGLGAAGMYALGKNAINKTRATYQGFDPQVQAYTRQSPY